MEGTILDDSRPATGPAHAAGGLPRLSAGGSSRYAACGLPTSLDMVTASFQWSAEEFLTAQRVHMRHSPQFRKFRRARWTIVPLGILGGGGVLVIHGLRPDGVLGLLCVVAGISFLAVPLFVRRMTLRHYARRPDRGMVVSWEFHPDYISTKTEASSSTFEWRMISRVLQATEGFLIYPNERIFHWLPIHAFCGAEDVESFTQLAKSKVQNFDRVG